MNKVFLIMCCCMGLSIFCFSGIQEGPIITGHITGFRNGTLIFLNNLSEQKTYDTAIIYNNEFVLRGPNLNEPIVLFLDVGDGRIWTSIVIGNDHVRIEGDSIDFPWNLRITGSSSEDENQK